MSGTITNDAITGDAKALLDLSAVDLLLLRIKKQIDELPQRAQLLLLRTKKAEIEAKSIHVAKMQKECEAAIKEFQDAEVMVKEKSARAQEKVAEAKNYKEVAAITLEIESCVKKLEKIEFETLKQMEQLDKIVQVASKVDTALLQISKQDADLVAAYQAQIGELKNEEAQALAERKAKMSSLPAALVARYEKSCEAKGAPGAAHVEGTHCSACRVEFTDGQMLRLKSSDEFGANIGLCPHCHRLLVLGK